MKTIIPTYWAKIEKDPNDIFQKKYIYIKGTVPTSRYVILFNTFTEYFRKSYSVSEYNDKEECLKECVELNELYKFHNLPTISEELVETYKTKYGRKQKSNKIVKKYDFSNNKTWWGYIVLDFEKCLIIKVGGYGFFVPNKLCISKLKNANTPENRDFFFRNTDEVPDNYKWDGNDEYQGWLRFKWGDGKNAINYIEPPKEKKINIEDFGYDIETEGLDDCLNNNYEQIEQRFADIIDKETSKRLMEKYGW